MQAAQLWGVAGPLFIAMPRIATAIVTAPLFPASVMSLLVRNTIVVSLVLIMYPHMAAAALPPMAVGEWLFWLAKEAFIGLLIGFAVGSLVWVFESVGAMIDIQTGASNSLLFDPFGGHEGGPTSGFLSRLAVVLFVLGGGLQVLVSLLFESFLLWPVASFYPQIGPRLADFGAAAAGSMVQLIVQLASPFILLLVLIEMGFGLLNRVMPQLNVFFFTLPLKGALAALMIAVYASWLADVIVAQTARLAGMLDSLARAVSGG